jgi:hypothetical protein
VLVDPKHLHEECKISSITVVPINFCKLVSR